eukprot:876941_1
MDDCGAVLHNIETKWLYDFLTLEKCRNFSQAAVSRNVSQPAFSRRIRALEQAIGVELFNRQVTPLQLSEQGKIFHSQIRHLLQQLESNLAELRGGSDYAQRKIKIAAAHSLSLGLLPSIISQMPPLFTWAIEAIDVDEAVDKLREGQSDCIFSFHDEDLLEAPQLPRSLDDAQIALAVINTTSASQIGLTPAKDGIFVEDKESPYVNLIVTREDNKDAENVKKFVQAYQSDEVYEAANKVFNGGAVKGW